jgi:iron complex transport system substrate-binding protein
MGQSRFSWSILLVSALLVAGCKKEQQAPTPPQSNAARPTVASMVPAATDLIIGMGAKDHLVAVSNFDREDEDRKGLPRVGDYERVDWEKVGQIWPDVFVIQVAQDQVKPGFSVQMDRLSAKVVNIKIDRLEDIAAAVKQIGEALKETEKAETFINGLKGRLDAVSSKTASAPKIKTLIFRDENAQLVIGPNNFLDDLLSIAGGQNAASGLGNAYPTIDAEMLKSLSPDAIFVLLPEASKQVLEKAHRTWENFPDVPAVKNKRVYILREWYVQQPGARVADLAELLASHLHPNLFSDAAATRAAR